MSGPLIEELEALRRRIVSGDLQDLDGTSAALEAGLAGLSGCDPGELARIRDAAAANARCLDAALRGLRAARRRVNDLIAAERPATYDMAGRRRDLGAQEPGLRL